MNTTATLVHFDAKAQLVLFAILLPTAVAGSNQWLYEAIPYSPWLRPWLYPWMTLTTAVLSWCAGRYLPSAFLRWVVFAWGLVLLDMLTLAACQDHRIADHFGYVLVSAEISLLVLWAVLGAVSWQWRLPAVLVVSPVVVGFSGIFTHSWWGAAWNVTMLLAAAAVTLVSLGLRLRGFRLESAKLGFVKYESAVAASQFGLKHMFVWAAAMVPMLLLVRGGADFFMWGALGDIESAFSAAAVGMSLATVNLIAIWLVLGGGLWIVRMLAFLVIPPLLAAALAHYSTYLRATYGMWSNVPILDAVMDMQQHWVAWLWLSAALLAALLLFLRASFYCLVRSSKSVARVSDS